jgi:hypothetical protein
MFLTDRVSAGKVRRTGDGYLVADAKVARTGIQDYLGSELGRPDMRIVRVYRPEAEVFSADAMRSYAHRPMTNNHPDKPVTAATWKDVAVGQTGGDVVRDGEFVTVPMVLMDAAAIRDYEAGKRELSMGYSAEIVFDAGITPDGQTYDAIQTNLKMNHLALVDRARGGDALRIGDDNPRKSTMNEIKTRTVLVDGLSVETTDAGAQAISKLQKDVTDATALYVKACDEHKTVIAAKDADLAKKDAEIDSLKGKVLTDAQIDARVQARADLIATAKQIADADYTGKSENEIRKIAVIAKLGDAAIKDKPDAYVQARFDILAEDSKRDPVRSILRGGPTHVVQDHGQSEYERRLVEGPNYQPRTAEGAR